MIDPKPVIGPLAKLWVVDVLLAVLSLPPPPQAASNDVAPSEAAPSSTWRRLGSLGVDGWRDEWVIANSSWGWPSGGSRVLDQQGNRIAVATMAIAWAAV